ncbi:hypothetical protein Q3G72_032603 [Acer saccharum]|nr:hypothetical protein Q3G72_032603 [Acer saccharum]
MKREWRVSISSSSSSQKQQPGGCIMGIFGFVLFLLFHLLMMPSHARQILASKQSTSSIGEVNNLIDFKKFSVDSDPKGYLSNWTSNSTSPCSFRGVFCSDDGHVTALNLNNFGLIGSLHLPSLTSLSQLQNLYLQGNSFSAGDLSTSRTISCNLHTVDLSSNNISGAIPDRSFLQSCDGLVSVNLSHNTISGASLHFGPSLLQLDLSRNRISNSTVLTYSLSSCQNLNLLNFSDNKLSGKLVATPSSSCKSLSTLDLSYNLLSGEIPPSFVADLPESLKYLDLSHNNFSGNFSDLDFGQCSNLTLINLSQNILSGPGFPQSLRNCQLLETLNLSRNALQDKIPGPLLGNLRNLKQLSIAHNQFSGEIPPELGQACGTLQELDFSSNKLTGQLPKTFTSCSYLHSLNLGNNKLSGDFLSTVVSQLSSLVYLYVPFNNITGPVPLSLTKCTKLGVLDISSNALTGNVPSGFCSSPNNLSALEKIVLANNYLSGTVPSELGNCKNLRTVDLSFNNFNGEIPSAIWDLPKLSDLVIWANNLTGEIPEGICVNRGNLETLILNNNQLTGNIPKSIASCTNLIWVSLSGNKLTGEIPADIGKLVSLAVLQLGNNSLTGDIPYELGKCRSLIWLDLNSNELSGALPSSLADQAGLVMPGIVSGKHFAFVRNEGGTACRGAGGLVEFEGIRPERLEGLPMVHSCPSTRIYSGTTVYTFNSNGSLIYLDLSYNKLSGTIPENFGSMNYLQVLNLGHNNLTGNIPDSFGGLKEIGVLDLSHNNFQGRIPGSLGSLSFLSDLDVSNNNLSGPIPSGGQLTTFPSSRYENNSGLCGLPLLPCSSGSHTATFHTQEKKQDVEAGVVIGITFFILCIFGLTLALYRVKKHQKKDEQREKYIESLPTSGSSSWKLSSVPEPLSINIATFEKPLRKLTFAHLLEATNGFSADSLIGSGGFGEVYKAQLKDGCVVAIKKLIHVTGQGDREFMAEMETIGKIKHRNLVPLLGYCKIGTPGYVPPEYYQSFRCTTKGDVYSYGVILLELLSGKRPIDPAVFGDDNNLVGWAKQLHREKRSSEILDTELMTTRESGGETELHQYLRIAFECLDDRPLRRPTMIQVMAMFKELQVDTESDSLDGFSLKEAVMEESREKEP